MRYFKLENADGEVLDITTEEFLFHDISGIGFEEDNDFVAIGRVWKLNRSSYQQGVVSGTMCFHSIDAKSPYVLYKEFYTFINKAPLVLLYYPKGLNTMEYRKRVRVSKLDKSEITELGVLECDIDFVSYTPWYKIVRNEINPGEELSNGGWIWDRGNKWRDSLDESYSSYHYLFNKEYNRTIRFDSEINGNGPVKLTIHGPITNPSWTHYVNGKVESYGGFVGGSPLTIEANESLTIDNTEGSYSMTVYNRETGVTRNVYQYRDFNKQCFFTLKQGLNEIVINSTNNDAIRIEAEGHIYYATV